MRQRIVFILSVCLLASATSFAQTKKPVAKPKPKTTTAKPKAKAKPVTKPAPAPVEELICYPMKEVKDYYKISLADEKFRDDFYEIFELSRYDYSGYSLKTIVENRIRTKLSVAAANTLDLFASPSSLEINFMKPDYKKQILDEICVLFSDDAAFEKYINELKPKKR
jgi:hypothetical protein